MMPGRVVPCERANIEFESAWICQICAICFVWALPFLAGLCLCATTDEEVLGY